MAIVQFSARSRAHRLRVRLTYCVFAMVGLFLAGDVWAQTGTGDSPPRTVSAAAATGTIVVDGLVDEVDWQRAPRTAGFTQRAPHDGQPASFPTEFQVLYDEHAIYVALHAFDPEPERIVGVLSRRDETSASDWLLVGFDSYFDRRTSFVFAVNPAGVQRDWMIYDDGATEDSNWNAIWQAAATIDERGWTAEMRIPLSQLRYSGQQDIWGMQVVRVIQRLGEECFWRPFSRGASGAVSHFGELTGLDDLAQAGGIEVIPFALFGMQHSPGSAAATNSKWQLGTDIRHRFSSNLVLSTTINPDFGQVEADPSDVNLSASETFFPEKRAFFLEGRDLFRMPVGTSDTEELFYSRRIGAPPHHEPDDYDELPLATRIYGAAKVSGKTADGWSFGALSALTGREVAQVTRADGTTDEEVVEPLTSYNVLSLRRDFREGRTNVATLVTTVSRDLDDSGLDWLHDQALSGGTQVTSKHFDDQVMVRARVLGSHVRGSPEALLETQQDHPHYFQRPGADHLKLDPTRTSMSGWSALLEANKIAGGRWRGGSGTKLRSPGFEINDLGFQQRSDFVASWFWIQMRDDEPGSWLNEWRVTSAAWTLYDFGGRHLLTGADVSGYFRNTSQWSATWGLGLERLHWNPNLLRGGPAVRMSDHLWLQGIVESDPRRRVRGTLVVTGTGDRDGLARALNVSMPVTFEAWHNVEFVLQPAVSVGRDKLQYVDTFTDDAGSTRRLLARVERATTSLTVRASYTFTANLSLQLYAQPYISAGRYTRYKQPNRPAARLLEERFTEFDVGSISRDDDLLLFESGTPTRFSADRPDFSFRQLRSTVVLRWEPSAGSALFLVWSHDRTSDGVSGRYRFGRDLHMLADEPGEHVVLLKLTWWLEARGPS